MNHTLVYRFWDEKKGGWRYDMFEGTMEEIEEFLTHTEIKIVSAALDRKPYDIGGKSG